MNLSMAERSGDRTDMRRFAPQTGVAGVRRRLAGVTMSDVLLDAAGEIRREIAEDTGGDPFLTAFQKKEFSALADYLFLRAYSLQGIEFDLEDE